MLNPGDVKVTYQRETWGTDQYGARVQVYEIGFTVRGQGNYTVTVPVSGFTAQAAQEAITAKATAICDTLDLFK